MFCFAIFDGVAEVYASGPSYEMAEKRAIEHVCDGLATSPEKWGGSLDGWQFSPNLPPLTKAYQEKIMGFMNG